MPFGVFDSKTAHTDDRITPATVSDKDMIIAVMGATGSGKSKFVSTVTGKNIAVGHGLVSCTVDVIPVSCEHPQFPGKRVIFLDTPGFDDSYRTDTDILQSISNWLGEAYFRGVKLSGILYLTRISDNRMSGTSLKNLQMFRKLCGTDSLKNVVLVTTMWSKEDKTIALDREKQLKETYWKTMMSDGARAQRFDDTRGGGWSIIGHLDSSNAVVLQIQEELVDQGKPLRETAAGSEVEAAAKAMIARLQGELEAVRAELQRTRMENDQLVKQLKEDRDKLQIRVKGYQEELKKLRKPKGWLSKLFTKRRKDKR